jgi:hypothetical protein
MTDEEPTVTEEGLVRYVETFLDQYTTAAEALLDPDAREQLIRYSFLPSRIITYVSSSSGVAINYVAKSEVTSVEGWSGPRRAEDFLFSIPEESRGKTKKAIGIQRAMTLTLDHMLFTNTVPLTIEHEDAEAIVINTQCQLGAASAEIQYAELYGTTRTSKWTERQARLRALQEVKLALTDVWRSQQLALPLTEIIRRRKEKTVLLLGSFKKAGRERLNQIRDYLVRHGYLPVLVDEFPDIEDQNLAQKVATIGLASRFVMVDDSEAAGQLYELAAVCKANDLLTVIVRERGQQASFMTRGVSTTSNVINEYDYDVPTLNDTLDEAIRWAERRVTELEQAYRSTYPWRDPDESGTAG